MIGSDISTLEQLGRFRFRTRDVRNYSQFASAQLILTLLS
jgi:hypothetical protein